jgi:hypothetical protein
MGRGVRGDYWDREDEKRIGKRRTNIRDASRDLPGKP